MCYIILATNANDIEKQTYQNMVEHLLPIFLGQGRKPSELLPDTTVPIHPHAPFLRNI